MSGFASEVVRDALRRYEDQMKQQEPQIAAIREIIRESREDFARDEFDTIYGPAERAKLIEEVTGRPAYWLARGRGPRT